MKKSLYNTIVNISSTRDLLYNSITNKYLLISKNQSLVLLYPENSIKNEYHSFYVQLVNIGYFINDDLDENEMLNDKIISIDSDNTTFTIIINPTLNCNFKCWYCYEDHVVKSKMDGEILNSIKRFINKKTQSENIEKIVLLFFGGEPLLYYRSIVLPIIEYCNECCKQKNISTNIGFTTNGYLLNDSIIEELKKNNVDFFQITLDGGKENHDKVRFISREKGSYNKIISNIIKLARKQLNVLVRINYTADNIVSVCDIEKDLSMIEPEFRNFLKINFQRVWQDRDKDKETENMIDNYLDEYTAKYSNLGFFAGTTPVNHINNSCYANRRNEIVINYDGSLYKCTAREFNDVNKVGILSKDGDLLLDQYKMNLRNNIRFTKQICQKCKIAPLCGGGCSQRCLETKDSNVCTYRYTEDDKQNIIINNFYNTLFYRK